MFSFRRCISVNGRLAPTARMVARLVDPFGLSADLEGLDMPVNVVDFSPAAKINWLFGPKGIIKAPYLCWRTNSKDIPLLQEIKAMVKQARCILGARAVRERRSLVFVSVRDKTILVANAPGRLSLALTGTPGVETGSFEDQTNIRGWFLVELDKDVKTFQCITEAAADSDSSFTDETEPEENDMEHAIKVGLEVLKGNPHVRHARWQPCFGTFRVTKKQNA